jgi:hypothetical protein
MIDSYANVAASGLAAITLLRYPVAVSGSRHWKPGPLVTEPALTREGRFCHVHRANLRETGHALGSDPIRVRVSRHQLHPYRVLRLGTKDPVVV